MGTPSGAGIRDDSDRTFSCILRRAWISWLAIGVLATLTCPRAVRAEGIVAVLGARLDPYLEALNGLRNALGTDVPFLVCGEDRVRVDGATRVVVTFGGRAALEEYPPKLPIVRCLAPGLEVSSQRSAATIQVAMLPRAALVLSSLLEIQPQLKRLWVPWVSDGIGSYVRQLEAGAPGVGVRVETIRLEHPETLPKELRQLLRNPPQAIWLPPDPLLVNRESFAVLRAFCRANRIALYAPSDGLVEKGAVGAVSSDFREIGRVAAMAARQLATAGSAQPEFYPERVQISINLTSAEECGITIGPAMQHKARIYR